MKKLDSSIFNLIVKTASTLPSDVVNTLETFTKKEHSAVGKFCLQAMLENQKLAKKKIRPICQDTGTLIFKIISPNTIDREKVISAINNAVSKATNIGLLRKNLVNAVNGKSIDGNIGGGNPKVNFEIGEDGKFAIYLLLKGGGCENVSKQHSLMTPAYALTINYLDAAKVAILKAVHDAQGYGCGPGILGICLGGDRESGFHKAKEQFWRKLDDINPDPELATLENYILENSNRLGIGPMGMGGNTTLLGVKIGAENRLPASYFVTISYMCWAFRRQGIVLNSDFSIKSYLY